MSPSTLSTGPIEASDCFLGFIQKQVGKRSNGFQQQEGAQTSMKAEQGGVYFIRPSLLLSQLTLCKWKYIALSISLKSSSDMQSEPNMSLQAVLFHTGINSLSTIRTICLS